MTFPPVFHGAVRDWEAQKAAEPQLRCIRSWSKEIWSAPWRGVIGPLAHPFLLRSPLERWKQKLNRSANISSKSHENWWNSHGNAFNMSWFQMACSLAVSPVAKSSSWSMAFVWDALVTRMDQRESAKVGIFQQKKSGFKMMKATSINKHGSPIKVMGDNWW